jgi:leader peptidase (prepilin peptidase)/N-methyltransferase
MSGLGAGALAGAAAGLLAAPYLAALTLTVPDRDLRAWWRPARPSPARLTATAGLGAGLGALAGAAAQWTPALPAFVVLALVGAPLVVVDLEHHRLPNRLVYPLAGAGAGLLVVAALPGRDWPTLLRALEGAATVFAVLFALNLVAPRSFGYGDVKLGGVLGAYLGWFGWSYVYYGIFGGFLLGALVALALLAGRRATMKTAIPFGPTLIVGALTVAAFDLVPTGLG